MKSKKGLRYTLVTLFIALVLAASSLIGLNAYVLAEDSQTAVQTAEPAQVPSSAAVSIVRESYENYPTESQADLESYFQGHGLTTKEKGRLTALQAAYAAGTRPKGKLPVSAAETGFAAIALNPADFAGMAAYYILPNRELTDEELLQLIAYGDQVGTPFTADTLTVKNCMRGGALEVNRMRSAGEDGRRTILFKRFSQEGLRPETAITPDLTVPLTTITDISVNPDTQNGLDSFRIYPIREVTDEEILNDLAIGNTRCLDPVKEGFDVAADEAQARKLLESVLGMPLSTEAVWLQYTRAADQGHVNLGMNFEGAKINGRQTSYWLQMDRTSGQYQSLFETTMDDSLYFTEDGSQSYGPLDMPQQKGDMNDPALAKSAQAALEKVTTVKVAKVEPLYETSIGNTHDSGVVLAVTLQNGSAWQAVVRYSDAKVCGLDYVPEGIQPPVNQ